MKIGAYDYLQKPVGSPTELRLLVRRALERHRLLALEERTSRVDVAPITLGYGDPAMEPVTEALAKVARTSATVLLLGESGTGKEVAARAIHARSDRTTQPFMVVNCAALSETLLESELFGHEKGAFTGASERRRGRIELADGGTFFLDEIGELKPALQAKLLRVIQERRFERVGGTRTIEVDVRWVAATNRDLHAMMADGGFREDLYHRLAVFPIRLPPLRDRRRDIVPLARLLLQRVCGELKRGPLQLSQAAEEKLVSWGWPGNVRELGNALERAGILADGPTIEADHIWLEGGADAEPTGLRTLHDLERDAIDRTLAAVGGNRRQAAEALGIGLRTLYDKLKRHEIE
jgi:two-component system response regulator FlrC